MRRLPRGARVAAIGELRESNERRRLGSLPGALAAKLRAAGRDIVVLGDGPVALAGMDRRGAVRIARGSLGELARRHDVVIAAAPDAAAAHRLLPVAPPTDTLVMLVAVSPAPDGQLTSAAIDGAAIEPGRLESDSTPRDGIVTLGDVAPTILGALGVARPDGMDGRPLRTRAAAADLERLLDLDARSARQIGSYRLIVYLAAAGLLDESVHVAKERLESHRGLMDVDGRCRLVADIADRVRDTSGHRHLLADPYRAPSPIHEDFEGPFDHLEAVRCGRVHMQGRSGHPGIDPVAGFEELAGRVLGAARDLPPHPESRMEVELTIGLPGSGAR